MIGACVFLFLAAALLLHAAENTETFRAAPYQAASSGMLLVLTGVMVFIGLTLRSEIALAFSFLVLCFRIKRPIP